MMHVDFGRALLDLLAAVIIQFMPAQDFAARDRVWLWVDEASRRYVAEVVKPAGDTMVVTIRLHEGEVRPVAFVALTAVKGKDGRFAWRQARWNGGDKARPVLFGFSPRFWSHFADSRFVVEPWKSGGKTLAACERGKAERGGADGYRMVFAAEGGAIAITVVEAGVVEIAVAGSVDRLDKPDHLMRLENPTGK